MDKILKTKSYILLFLLLWAFPQSSAPNTVKQSVPIPREHENLPGNKNYLFIYSPYFFSKANKTEINGHKAKEDLLTVQNTDRSKKTRIKKRMQYIDKILEEIDRILYTKEKTSDKVLQKIKRLLLELEKLQRDRDL